MRQLDNNLIQALQEKKIKPVTLIQTSWLNGEIYLTNYIHNITHNNIEYTAMGNLLAIDDIEESLKLQAINGSISLSGLPSSIQALVQEEFTHGNIQIYLALIDNSNNIISEPILLQQGFMDDLQSIDDWQNGSMNINVNYTTDFARFDDTNGRKSNPSEHKNNYPGDLFFDSVPKLSDQVLEW